MNLSWFISHNTFRHIQWCFCCSQMGSSTWSEVQGEFLWLNLGDLIRPQILSSVNFTVCDGFVLVDGDRSSRVFYAEWSATSLFQRISVITAWRFETLLRCKQRLAKYTFWYKLRSSSRVRRRRSNFVDKITYRIFAPRTLWPDLNTLSTCFGICRNTYIAVWTQNTYTTTLKDKI